MVERGRTQDSPPWSPISKGNWTSDSHRPLQAEVPQRGVAGNDWLLEETVTSQPKPRSSQNSPNQIKLILRNTVKPSSCPPFLLSSPKLPETVETLTQKELLSGYQGEKKIWLTRCEVSILWLQFHFSTKPFFQLKQRNFKALHSKEYTFHHLWKTPPPPMCRDKQKTQAPQSCFQMGKKISWKGGEQADTLKRT